MNQRTKKIREANAIVMSKATHCLTCGSRDGLTPSHLLKSFTPSKRYEPWDTDNITVQCLRCHQDYEWLSRDNKAKYWDDRGFPAIAKRIRWMLDLSIN